MKAKGMLIDFTRCVGCKACVAACKKGNRFPPESLPLKILEGKGKGLAK